MRDMLTGAAPTSPYAGFCQELPSRNATTCTQGLSLEANQCGFFFAEDTQRYCASTPDDSCCSTFKTASAASAGTVEPDAPPEQQCGFTKRADFKAYCTLDNLDPCCTSLRAATLDAVTASLAPVDNNPWIITGIVVAIVTSLIVCFILVVGCRRWQTRSTSAVVPVADEKGSKEKTKSLRQSEYGTIMRGRNGTRVRRDNNNKEPAGAGAGAFGGNGGGAGGG
ncbi:hypothetical protein HK102_006515, partial [Quaeritorhiza haematococci]